MGRPPLQPIEVGQWADGRRVALNDATLYDEATRNVEARADCLEPYGTWQMSWRSPDNVTPSFTSPIQWWQPGEARPRKFQAWAEGYDGVPNTDYFTLHLSASPDPSDASSWETLATLSPVQDDVITKQLAATSSFTRDLRAGEYVRVTVLIVNTPLSTVVADATHALHWTLTVSNPHARARHG